MSRACVALSLVVAALTSPALAQPHVVPHRHGLWGSIGLGIGSAGVSCSGCGDDRAGGVSGQAILGGTLRPNLLLAGETNGWTKEAERQTDAFSYLTAVIVYYPAVTEGFFLKGGLGVGTLEFEGDFFGVPVKLESTGPAIVLGAGYDIAMRPSFSITLFGNYLTTIQADAEINGLDAGADLDGNLLQLGVAATWH